jgi:hypothetical protein
MTPRPRPQPKPVALPRPARPAQPGGAAPVQRSAAPVSAGPPRAERPIAPAAPHLPPQPTVAEPADFVEAVPSSSYAEGETTGIQPVDEDDAVIVPAAPLSYLGHGDHHAHHPLHAVVSNAVKAQNFRQTMIPLLLTTGALLLTTAVLKYVVHPDALLAQLPAWLTVVLAVAAVLVLGVAGLNMAQAHRYQAAAVPGSRPA